tara:strand:- start:423725 stop:424030 length:306 start_codon:yes stop_codon:yes gene_type:complete
MSELSCLFRAEVVLHTGSVGNPRRLRINADDIVKYSPYHETVEERDAAKKQGEALSRIYYAHACYGDYDMVIESDEEIAELIDVAEMKRVEKVKALKFFIA